MDENMSASNSIELFDFRLPPVPLGDSYLNARLNSISLDEVRQIVREEIRAALKERD